MGTAHTVHNKERSQTATLQVGSTQGWAGGEGCCMCGVAGVWGTDCLCHKGKGGQADLVACVAGRHGGVRLSVLCVMGWGEGALCCPYSGGELGRGGYLHS